MKTTSFAFDGLMVLEYQAGNKKSLSILVNRHHNRLCRHSFRYTQDVEASKDIVQDAWRIIIKKINTLREPNSFSYWATRIVTRKSLDYINQRKKDQGNLKVLAESQTIAAREDPTGNERIHGLLKGIKALPDNQQMVLRLFYTEGYSLREITEILDISIGTAKSRLYHAREKLKKILKDK
ncbi:RNA polymerase sigma factor [Flagellimonas myxillae]|uniref:RNA polymerase sigma factor n=1 Tax=Flagellimonas myxillae TaxID=2942214 RepID=UPI00201F222F|nr:sigma-70 family RNA polymerase sigma factor [Muricauda myxillae]MCL6266492.1 sigma-70 family RNA polymerase sigma factor [Muricauda myxillae]